MLPLRDNVPTRRFPVVTVAIIAVNFGVWIFYELPNLNRAILDSGYFPCEPVHDCIAPDPPWWIDLFSSMFMHGGWEHILGNMLFLGSSATTSRTPSAGPASSPSTSRAGCSRR